MSTPEATPRQGSNANTEFEPNHQVTATRQCTKVVLAIVASWLLVQILSEYLYILQRAAERLDESPSWETYLIHESFSGGNVMHDSTCIQEKDWTATQDYRGPVELYPEFVSQATLNILLPSTEVLSESLSFSSRGCRSGGSFSIITSPNQPMDTVSFNISRRFSTAEASNGARICVKSGQHVEIFTPNHPHKQATGPSQLQFYTTTMILPELEEGSGPLRIRDFRTDVVDTVQQIGNIGSKVFFERISLNSNTPSSIHAESLTGESIDVRSLGGAIRGTFNSTKVLQLTTSNAPIMVSVNLNDTDIFGIVTPSIIATTSNSPIQATIGLFRPAYPDTTNLGRYFVSAQTSNSPVELEFKAAPLDSTLNTMVSTTNSPVTVVTHPTYEGDFSLSTTIGEVEIDESSGTVDPSGKGRSRQFQYTDIQEGVLKGTVYWEEERPTWPFPGYPATVPGITLSTSNSPIILVL